VQGKVGGYTGYVLTRLIAPSFSYQFVFSYPDKVRGIFNEGGLFGERQGWHLPGFNTSSWADRDLSAGLPNSSAGVGFFVSTFDLNIPSYNDVFMSFTFDQSSQPYRAYLFVNGWMMGKRVANLGLALTFISLLLITHTSLGPSSSSLFMKASWIIAVRSKYHFPYDGDYC
jgi:hypothetical protein